MEKSLQLLMDRVDDMNQDIVKYNTYSRNLSKQQQQKHQVILTRVLVCRHKRFLIEAFTHHPLMLEAKDQRKFPLDVYESYGYKGADTLQKASNIF